MRVRHDWKRLSIATLLLFLFAEFAISPPEYHRRNSTAKRSRVTRTVRLDDQDHDHLLVASELAFDLDTSSRSVNSPPFEALLPPGSAWNSLAEFAEFVRPFAPAGFSAVSSRPDSGRAPPAFC